MYRNQSVPDVDFIRECLVTLDKRLALDGAKREGNLIGAPADWDSGDDFAVVIPLMASRPRKEGGLAVPREALAGALDSLQRHSYPKELRKLLVMAIGLAGDGARVAAELRAALYDPPRSGRLRSLAVRAAAGQCGPSDLPQLIRLLRDDYRFMPIEPTPGEREAYWQYPVRAVAAERLKELGIESTTKIEGSARGPVLDHASAVGAIWKWLSSGDAELVKQALKATERALLEDLIVGLAVAIDRWVVDPEVSGDTRAALRKAREGTRSVDGEKRR
ncbi:MAG: hypothetical protein K8T90_17055 [Planctomycetes bacterium]|nr:hypothetical protein [Planctomycetota bacterium]